MPKLAVSQIGPKILDFSGNLDRIVSKVNEAANNDAELIIFPELSLTGICLTKEEAKSIARSVSYDNLDKLVDLCSDLGVFVVVGMLEKAPKEKYHNATVLIGPNGILGHYRKTHLPKLGVDQYLNPGEELVQPIETDVGKLGFLICWDILFPEATRVLTLSGAQIVIVPTNWLASNPPSLEFYHVRAAENGIYVVWANRVGLERGFKFMGRSGVAGPDGEVLARASSDNEETLYVDIDLSKAHRGKISGEYEMDIEEERRPELYGIIVKDKK